MKEPRVVDSMFSPPPRSLGKAHTLCPRGDDARFSGGAPGEGVDFQAGCETFVRSSLQRDSAVGSRSVKYR
jgi:hypothetical protein